MNLSQYLITEPIFGSIAGNQDKDKVLCSKRVIMIWLTDLEQQRQLKHLQNHQLYLFCSSLKSMKQKHNADLNYTHNNKPVYHAQSCVSTQIHTIISAVRPCRAYCADRGSCKLSKFMRKTSSVVTVLKSVWNQTSQMSHLGLRTRTNVFFMTNVCNIDTIVSKLVIEELEGKLNLCSVM